MFSNKGFTELKKIAEEKKEEEKKIEKEVIAERSKVISIDEYTEEDDLMFLQKEMELKKKREWAFLDKRDNKKK